MRRDRVDEHVPRPSIRSAMPGEYQKAFEQGSMNQVMGSLRMVFICAFCFWVTQC